MPTYHRVDSKRRPRPPCQLPQDHWQESSQERIFVEAETGDEFVVMYSGKMPSGFWPEGMDVSKERQPARVHLTRRS